MDPQSSREAGKPDGHLADPSATFQLAAALGRVEELGAALDASLARERALHFELQHRVRNLMSVIRSIYRRSRESDSSGENFAEHFEGRLGAIARYQAHFDDLTSFGFDLEDMVRNELLEARCVDGSDYHVQGPPVSLPQKAAELIGLALHELTTNAIKFGALGQGGQLSVRWSVKADGEQRWLDLAWIETGVSVTRAAPRPNGFGRQLIEEALPYQLGAITALDLGAGRVACSIVLPLAPPFPNALSDDDALLPTEKEAFP